MKKITILTLFKDVVANATNFSILKKAKANKKVKINIVDFRLFSKNKHKKVDDTPYGGGAGMVLSLQPIVDAIKAYTTKNSHVVLLSPQGKKFNQTTAKQYAKSKKDLVLICGHYEGFDQRIINYVDEVISIGDYVLTGGELPAAIITDAVVRLLNGVITKQSLNDESFENNLLDYDNYTKPLNFQNYSVPKILLSGNHKLIKEFRQKNKITKTKKQRPDLFSKYAKTKK